VIEQVAINGARPPIPPWLPEQLRLLIESCWHPDPTKRPGFDALAVCFQLLLAGTAVGAGGAGDRQQQPPLQQQQQQQQVSSSSGSASGSSESHDGVGELAGVAAAGSGGSTVTSDEGSPPLEGAKRAVGGPGAAAAAADGVTAVQRLHGTRAAGESSHVGRRLESSDFVQDLW